MHITSIKVVFLFLASASAVSLYVKDEDTGMYRQQEVSRVSGSQTGGNGLTSAQIASFAQRAAESTQAMGRSSSLLQANPNSNRISHVSSSPVSESEPIRETAQYNFGGRGVSCELFDRLRKIEESRQRAAQRFQERRAARAAVIPVPPEKPTIMQRIVKGCYKVVRTICLICWDVVYILGGYFLLVGYFFYKVIKEYYHDTFRR